MKKKLVGHTEQTYLVIGTQIQCSAPVNTHTIQSYNNGYKADTTGNPRPNLLEEINNPAIIP